MCCGLVLARQRAGLLRSCHIEASNPERDAIRPRLFLTDLFSAQAAVTTPEPNLESYEILISRLRPTAEELQNYKLGLRSSRTAYRRWLPCRTFFVVAGLEHIEHGNL